jgi:acyl-CoA thioesterase-1
LRGDWSIGIAVKPTPRRVSAVRKLSVPNVSLAVLAIVVIAFTGWVIGRDQTSAATDPGSRISTRPLSTSTASTGPRDVLILGDSYAAGTGASRPERRWVNLLAAAENWKIANYAQGGTGYLTEIESGGQRACGAARCLNYADMLAAAVDANVSPDIVLVSGGRNDLGEEPGQVGVAIRSLYVKIRKSFPAATIYAVNPLWDDGNAPNAFPKLRATVTAAVENVRGTLLNIGQPLKGRSSRVIRDGVHPNDAGHKAIAEAVEKALVDQTG